MNLYIKTFNGDEPLEQYCKRLSKKNNSILYQLENYLSTPLLSNPELTSIRDHILTVSADIERIQSSLIECDSDERF